jgi:hypothetical protein
MNMPIRLYCVGMADWEVIYAPEFDPEHDALDEAVQDELTAHLLVLAQVGPSSADRWQIR